MYKLEKGNLLGIIEGCLKEHQVDLAVDGSRVPFYLIESRVASPLAGDFADTYPEADDFKKRLAVKLLGDRPAEQVYGILVDTGLKYSFAFNRKFADLNSNKDRIVFKGVEDVLLEASEGKDLSEDCDLHPDQIDENHDDGNGGGMENIQIKYAIAGGKRSGSRKNRRSSTGVDLAASLSRNSMLDRIKLDYKKREIWLDSTEESERFFLVNTAYQTNRFEDFVKTYGNEISDFQRKLAQKLFGTSKEENNYGIVFSEDLTMKFAFNTGFAAYDPRKKSIVYMPAEDLLLLVDPKRDLSELPEPPIRRHFPSVDSLILKYALVGKKD